MKIKNLLLLFLILCFTCTLLIECGNSSKHIFSFSYLKESCKGVTYYLLKSFSLTKKDRLDSVVGKHWNDWKISGNDTTKCVIDFSEIMPFEWDTLVYFYRYKLEDSKELFDYSKKYSIGSGLEGLHFLKEGNIVYYVNLEMSSDDENGVCFCTNKDIIKRSRKDTKFHIVKKGLFYVFCDMTEECAPIWRFDK